MARSAHREAVGYFEQALSALPHLPEQRDTREQAIDLRLALRSALLRLATMGASWRICARPRPSRWPSTTRVGWDRSLRFLSLHFYRMGAYDQAIAAAQRALALATASGDVVLHALANQYLGYRLPGPGRLSSGDRLLQADRGVPRRGAAPRALRSGLPARRALPCPPRLVPCRAGHVRRGQCPRGRRAADCRGGCSPREPHVCLLGDRSAGPPPGRPAQGAPPARTGRGHLSGRGPPELFPLDGCGLGGGVHAGRARR